jgi:hypothetical protein
MFRADWLNRAIFAAIILVAQDAPEPACVIDITSLLPRETAANAHSTVMVFTDREVVPPVPKEPTAGANGSVTFLSDHTLAVGMCFKSRCGVQAYDVADAKPRLLANAEGLERFNRILRYSNGGVLLDGVGRGKGRGAILLDRDLQASQWIPETPGISASGDKITGGPGRLLAHSGDLAAYQDQRTVRIEGARGEVAAFGIETPKGWSSPTIVFLGGDLILFEGGIGPQVRDLRGAIVHTIKKPEGALGERIRRSEDGSRLLYDSFTRRVGVVQGAREKVLEGATMGMAADGYAPNGEFIRVIDTRTGAVCFEWYASEKLLPPFADHADIDPSGQLVAIMTRGALAIFRLPDACTGR